MDAFEDGEVSEHPNFFQILFQANEKTTIHDREIVIKERNATRRFGPMQHFHFCLTSLKKDIENLARTQ
jgi:hypothetical protein